jgi:hypothetical protein
LPDDFDEFYNSVSKFEKLKIKGLMAMGPNTSDAKEIDRCFSSVKKLYDKHFSDGILSMGMSNDYKIALKNGANMVRIGSALFRGNI